MPETFTVRGVNLTVELVLHRKFGVRGRELMSETLQINPGLAGAGTFLPLGTSFTIPDLPAPTTARIQQRSLFRD